MSILEHFFNTNNLYIKELENIFQDYYVNTKKTIDIKKEESLFKDKYKNNDLNFIKLKNRNLIFSKIHLKSNKDILFTINFKIANEKCNFDNLILSDNSPHSLFSIQWNERAYCLKIRDFINKKTIAFETSDNLSYLSVYNLLDTFNIEKKYPNYSFLNSILEKDLHSVNYTSFFEALAIGYNSDIKHETELLELLYDIKLNIPTFNSDIKNEIENLNLKVLKSNIIKNKNGI